MEVKRVVGCLRALLAGIGATFCRRDYTQRSEKVITDLANGKRASSPRSSAQFLNSNGRLYRIYIE